jgi:hypothetical protein
VPICKMCGNDRKLINSHIIPKSFWNIQKQGAEPLAVLSNRPGWRPVRSPIGEYDNNILCEQCDNQLGLFDQHVYEKLVLDLGAPLLHHGTPLGFTYSNSDPILVKKFILSLVWRASISSRDYFCRISLGPYEDIFRNSFMGNETSNDEISCLISEFDQRDVAFLNPQYSRMDGVKFAVVFANRFTFYAKVDKKSLPEFFRQSEIKQGNSVTSILRDWEGSKQQQAMRQLVHQNPRPRFWN